MCAVTSMFCVVSNVCGVAIAICSVALTAGIIATEGTGILVRSLSAHAGLATVYASTGHGRAGRVSSVLVSRWSSDYGCAGRAVGTAARGVQGGRVTRAVGLGRTVFCLMLVVCWGLPGPLSFCCG